jgi:hypothetical protein
VTDKKFWPLFAPDYTWPNGVPRSETLAAFQKFYESYGYLPANDGSFEEGIEKIAIYVGANGKPTHAARQIDMNMWASKLGRSYGVQHRREAVSGGLYGQIAAYMARKKSS